MGNSDDLFDEFQHSLDSLDGNFHVLETNVPVEKQMEYFDYSENVKRSIDDNTIDNQIVVLNSPDATLNDLKYAKTYLAVSGDVKAYRALETYSKEHKDEKDDWTVMALLQAKITLESEFSDQKQFFISTGLGGKGHNLRFFSFFGSKESEPFSAYQKELIEKEFSFQIHNSGGEMEKLVLEENYFTIEFLIDLHANIKKMLEDAMAECNQFGDFINPLFVVTNVKRYSEAEIWRELGKK